MTIQAREAVAAKFLRDALTSEAVPVRKLDVMARAAGLLSERQHITHARVFRRAKKRLGIRSVRDRFGRGGRWSWELPRDRDAPSATTSGMSQPIRVARRVPADWIDGVARLQYHRPPSDVPLHRWRQFVDDCNRFLNSPEAERASQLGWNATTLFGSRPNHPLMYLGQAGLLWRVEGGRVVEVHRGWAVIDRPVNRSQRVVYRRDVDEAKIALPWVLGGVR